MRPTPERTAWLRWIDSVSDELAAGRHVRVPEALPALELAGFVRPLVRVHKGQSADWALSLPDGSRLHVHAFGDELVAHRDRFDPGRGLASAALHVVTETPLGRLVGRFAGVAAVLLGFRGAR
jgi:hypothetical protein